MLSPPLALPLQATPSASGMASAVSMPPAGGARDAAAIRAAAEALEASFLSVMLQAAGLGQGRESFGGGIGEAQFASFLAEAHAAALARRGGIGLSESLVRALSARDGGEGVTQAADTGGGIGVGGRDGDV